MTTTTDMQGQAAANVMEARESRPHRVQLSRKKGWRMPENTVSVARPGPFGNPYKLGMPDENGMYLNAPQAVAAFKRLVLTDTRWSQRIEALRGKNLACWCRLGDWCHADVLLDLANRDHAPIVQREVG
jgi:hypothetical protein